MGNGRSCAEGSAMDLRGVAAALAQVRVALSFRADESALLHVIHFARLRSRVTR